MSCSTDSTVPVSLGMGWTRSVMAWGTQEPAGLAGRRPRLLPQSLLLPPLLPPPRRLLPWTHLSAVRVPPPYRGAGWWGRGEPTASVTPHLCSHRPTPGAPRQSVPVSELVVPLLVHHGLGDLDRHRARLLRGEAVAAQHHAVGLGGAGRGQHRGSVLCPLATPQAGTRCHLEWTQLSDGCMSH